MFADMMAFIVFIFIGVSQVCEITGSSQPGALIYRHQRLQAYDGNFKPELYHYLLATTITSSFVVDAFDCVFACMGETKCYSFNMAAFPDASGLYLCELLATDKYRASESDLQENSTFHHFSPLFPCKKNNPCQNNGACVPNFEQHDYHCDCQPGFAGIFCQRTGKTCSDIRIHSSQAVSADYVIDPDGEGGYKSFTAYCDMTDKNGVGVTVVSHDSEARTLVDGYEAKGSYSRDVHYTAVGLTTVSQLAGLTTASTNCEQFIKYECVGSSLLNNGNKYGWWVSRNYEDMDYWGGATPADTYKCSCGLTNSCADPSDGCNCDKDDGVWREDSGLLTEKSDLPVLQLRFGDTGDSSESGYHTLGKFKCYGSSIPGKTCSDIKSQSSQAVSGDYVIDPDGEGGYKPFTVYCDMTDKNGVGVTVVSHDSEAKTLVDGYEEKGSYSRNVHYIAGGLTTVSQLAALATASASCEQFIKYECVSSILLINGAKNGWWVSRNMVAMDYWGGATPADTYKCACGLTNSCADPSDGCNCDINDSVWREDSGLLTEKSDLPVMQLRFGDTGGSSESGYHTLGKFKCSGSV
ncbi:hypothetical protein ACROYT_G017221 [Oculina patagonica]